MKILTRYVLKQHIGPLLFALTALTSLLMLQYVARQLGNLVGKGIPWKVIGEFFVLSLPFTVAMTMPMAVLVATLHAFGRMASENEITAFKASGVRVTSLMTPVLIGAAFLVLGMIGFNDQILPRANHRLRVLQQDMARAKPTLALTEQVLNQVSAGFYMRIGRLDAESNRMTDVTLYDMTQPQARKTIYADSGDMSFTPDKKDLQLVLYDGYQEELGSKASQLQRSYFRSQAVRVKDIGGDFEQSGNDSWKGNREKSICEMQSEYVVSARDYERVRVMYIDALRRGAAPGQKTLVVPKPRAPTQGLARVYCNALALVFRLPTAQLSEEAAALAMAQAANPALVGPSPVLPPPTPNGAPPSAGTPSPSVAVVPGAPTNGRTTNGATPTPVALSPGMQAQLDAAKKSMLAGGQQPQPQPPPVQSPTVQPPVVTGLPQPATVAIKPAGDSSKPSISVATTARNDSTVVAGGTASNTTPPAAAVAPPAAPVTAAAGGAANPPVTSAAGTNGAPASVATALPATTGAVMTAVPAPSVVVPPPVIAAAVTPPAPTVPANATVTPATPRPTITTMSPPGNAAEVNAALSQLIVVRGTLDDLAVEVQKKFALSVACIVFILFGPPIALRFPRGGVGATLGVSLVVFGLYYICLMAGETLADDGKLPPVVAMWAANVIFTVLGLALLLRIEKTADASRGGGVRAWLDDRRAKRALKNVRLPVASSATV